MRGEGHREGTPVSRREFLSFTILGVGVVVPGVRRLALPPRGSTGRAVSLLRRVDASPVDLHRAADFVDITFTFTNLTLNGNMLESAGAGDSLITMQLNRQHVAEHPITGDAQPATVQSRLAGQSRLVFVVDPASLPLPYTAEKLLDRSGDVLKLVPLANDPGPNPPAPAPPADDETAIEWPRDLFFTPRGPSASAEARFRNRTETVDHNEFIELWHTQFVLFKDGELKEPPDATLRARFAWTTGYDNPDPNEIVLPIDADQRVQLVDNTVDYDDPNVDALYVNKFLLTALGAQADVSGDWPDAELTSYDHRTMGGRDAFVRIVERGYLFPLGVLASEVTISERRFLYDGNTTQVAYLYEETLLQVSDTAKEYPAPHQQDEARAFPFRSVRVTNGNTGPIEKDAWPNDVDITTDEAYYVQKNGEDYLFTVVGTDWDGQESTFSMPMAFVALGNSYGTGANTVPTKLRNYLDDLADTAARRKVEMQGQSVAVAESSAGEAGDTTQPVVSFTLGAEGPEAGTTLTQLENDRQPAFYPIWTNAKVRPGAAEAITGEDVAGITFEFNPDYLSDGFDTGANPSALYLQLPDGASPPDLSVPDVSRLGGIATPSLLIQALSRTFGPTGGNPVDLNGPGGGSWDPADVFGDALSGAKLLGSLTLSEVIKEVTHLATNALKLPKWLTHFEFPGGDTLQIPERSCTTLDWDPELKSIAGLFLVDDEIPDNPFDGETTLHMHGEFCVPIAADEDPTYEVTGELRNFAIQLLPSFPVLLLYFERVEFTAGSSAPTTVDANVLDVVFEGPLTFVEIFRSWLSSLGNGPRIDVDGEKVTAGVSIDIPDLGFGVFALTQMAFSIDFAVPFNGDPVTVSFGFSSREDPFLVTVMGLGGGGHFGITLAPDGLVALEFSIDVGAQVAIDLIVASGSVGVTAGFSYEVDVTNTDPLEETITLMAYVNVSGEMSVLGLITLSVEVEIALTYVEEEDNGTIHKTLTGTARVEVEVDVTFVHTSVSLDFSYTFAAGDSPAPPLPNGAHRAAGVASASGFHFGDLYADSDDWTTYCTAFAPA